ncbi:ankyrin repeat-containing domain protein, partial [Hyaloscypha sp. PMI_1271]
MFESWPHFCTQTSIIRDSWLKTYWSYAVRDWAGPDNFGMIDLAAFFGITPLLSNLLAKRSLQSLDILPSAINKQPHHNMTSLHWACRNGHEEAVRLLLDRASISKRGYGMTPLTWAVRNGHAGVVKILLKAGASSELKDYGMTSLNWAAWEGKLEVARILMSHDAKINAATTQGNTQPSWLINTKSSTGEFPWATAIEAADIFKAAELAQEVEIIRNSAYLHFLETIIEFNFLSLGYIQEDVSSFVGRRLTNRIWLSNRTGQIRGHSVCWAAVTTVGKFHILYDLLRDYKYVASGFAKAYESFPQPFHWFGVTSLVLWLYAYSQSLIQHTVINLLSIIGYGIIGYLLPDSFVRTCWPFLYIATHWTELRRGVTGLLIEVSSFVVVVIILICNRVGHEWAQYHLPLIMVMISAARTLGSVIWSKMSKISHGYTSLYLAASRGHGHVVRLLIENGGNTAIRDSTGRTALQVAMENGYIAVVHTFLEKEAELAGRYYAGSTSLQLAASLGHLHLVKELFKRGIDVDRCSKVGWTALHSTAYYGLLDVVRFLCEEAKTNAISAKDDEGWTPLHLASSQGKTGICLYLHAKGADVKSQTAANYTPLHLACYGTHLDTVKALLDIGSDIEARAELQYRALHLSAMQGSLAVVTHLIENRAEINSMDSNRVTPLHFASRHGHSNIVVYLLEHGADPNITSKTGYSSLHYAAIGGSLEVARRLVSGGADTSHNAYSDILPLVLAIRNDNKDVLECLLEAAADPNLVDRFGRTPFDYASEKPSLFNAVLRFHNCHPTPEQVRLDTRRRTVDRLARELLEAPPKDREFEDLGFALLQLRRFEESKTAYSWLGCDVESNRPACDACSVDTGLEAHTCHVCFQVYLCNSCMERYRDGLVRPRGCQNHEYLAFRGENWGKMDSQERSRVEEDQDAWLRSTLE